MLIRHEYSALFPNMAETDFTALVNSIKTNGFLLDYPIIILDKQVLDGWHRYTAALQAGIKEKDIPMGEYMEDIDPLTFVITTNENRRHLTTSQRAMIAANISTLTQGKKKTDKSVSQDDAAKKMKVSPTQVKKATKIKKVGTPKQIEEVKSGSKTVNKIYEEIRFEGNPAGKVQMKANVSPELKAAYDELKRDRPLAELLGDMLALYKEVHK